MAKKIATVKEVVEQKEQAQPEGYLVYADFELLGVSYKEGGRFVPPAHLQRDEKGQEVMKLNRPKGESLGLLFQYEGEVIDKGSGEREVKRVILPLEEA